jgi:hypothetical protein
MASVTIDIPGIGNVEAKNAASEATLRELVSVIKSSKGGGGSKDDVKNQKDRNNNQKEDNNNHKTGTQRFKELTQGVAGVAGGFFKLGSKLTDTVSMFAELDGSVTDAAAIFNKLPIVGGLVGGAFTAVAGAADRVTKSFVNAAGGGASFGGSMASFSASASAAGMNMAEFGSLVKSNGEGMMAFGTTTEDGAKNFAQVSKAVRSTSSELYALGMSTEEINGGLARYGALLRSQGLAGGKTNAQMAAGAKTYLKEMDGLAKITGEERSAKEAQAAALAKDAQFQAAMAGQNEEVQKSFRNTVLGLPGPLQNFTKDMLANGTATTEENQKLLAQLPESAAMLTTMQQKMQRGEAITDAERNALNNKMKEEGAKNLKNIKGAAAADASLASTTNALAATYQIATDGVKKAGKQQGDAAKNTDKMNEKMQKFQQSLAELGNTFSMALASSGMLDVLMSSFQILGNLVTTYVLPAFMIFSDIIASVGNYLVSNLKPIFESIGNFIKDSLYPAFLTLAAFILVDIVPVLQSMAAAVNDYVVPVFNDIANLIGTYVMPVFESIGTFIADNLMPIFLGLGTALMVYAGYQAIASAIQFVVSGGLVAMASGLTAVLLPLLPFALAVGGLVLLFKKLYDGGWTFGTAIDAVKDNLQRFWLTLVDAVNGLLSIIPNALGGISKDEAVRRKALTDATRKELDEKEKSRDSVRKEVATERSSEKKKEAREQKKIEIDKKLIGLKDSHNKKLGTENEKAEAALAKTNFNTNNSLDLLKSEVAIAGTKPGSMSAAETGKKEIETKKEAEVKAKADKEEKKKTEGATPSAPTQESAESLLASLNTKLDQLIKVNMYMQDVQDRQLRVQQGLSGDLFASV